MKLAGAEEEVGQLGVKRGIVVIVLDVVQHAIQLLDFQLPGGAPATDHHGLSVDRYGLLEC
jgi:hypothetical protein